MDLWSLLNSEKNALELFQKKSLLQRHCGGKKQL